MNSNYSSLKLIVSDLDGTLLNNNHQISDLFFEQFWKLKEKGILFAAASGRPFYSILNDLKPIEAHIFIIAENGAIVRTPDNKIEQIAFPNNHFDLVNTTIQEIPNAIPIFCTKEKAYIHFCFFETYENIFKAYYHRIHWYQSQTEINEEIVKIAVYHPDNSETGIYPYLNKLQVDVLVKISGPHWVDIAHKNANKGAALKLLQNQLGIGYENTMAFGDYLNDLEMLQGSKFSFAMENAHPLIKSTANFQTEDNNNFGVEKILEKILS